MSGFTFELNEERFIALLGKAQGRAPRQQQKGRARQLSALAPS